MLTRIYFCLAGSAEDGEDVDEEIRMINEGQPRQRHNADDDNLSDVSVHNTQEYLARLGIIDSHNTSHSHSSVQKDGNGSAVDMLNHRRPMSNTQSLNIFDDDGTHEANITNIIYAKLNDVVSERGKIIETALFKFIIFLSLSPPRPQRSKFELETGPLNWTRLV